MAPQEQFSDPDITAKGEPRAYVDPTELTTIWFNTGTLCNLTCENCYIESSPRNDRLVYISHAEVTEYLNEISREQMQTREIAFTGGEPFMNPDMIPILTECLSRGYEVLVLTNAMRPMEKQQEKLLKLRKEYGEKLKVRVSVDHYTKERHEQERGERTFDVMLRGLQWLSDNGFPLSVAGRTLWGDDLNELREGFAKLFQEHNINVDTQNHEALILFPEMDEKAAVPEITTECWSILNKTPDSMMCASSRMVVKRKGQEKPSVVACTLLPYEEEFELGGSLKESLQRVKLNHPHCAKFCVLGGGSCST